MIEHYLVRQPQSGSPDPLWIAYVDYDAQLGTGEIRWQGGLEGQIDAIAGDRAALEAQFATWRDVDGYQIDRI